MKKHKEIESVEPEITEEMEKVEGQNDCPDGKCPMPTFVFLKDLTQGDLVVVNSDLIAGQNPFLCVEPKVVKSADGILYNLSDHQAMVKGRLIE